MIIEFTLYIVTAIALVLVVEGLIYLLFPDKVRQLMAMAVMMPVKNLRMLGLAMAITGFSITLLLDFWTS